MPTRRDLYLDDVPTVGSMLRERQKKEEESELKIKEERRKSGISIREDMTRRNLGLTPRYGRGTGRGQTSRTGGYRNVADIPQFAGDVPLKGVRQDVYTGTYLPSYEREPVPEEIRKERGYAQIASEKKQAEARRRMMYPTGMERIGDALTSRIAGFIGGRNQRAGGAEPDYDGMTEDELYALAQKGDRRAVEAGKRRFGNS